MQLTDVISWRKSLNVNCLRIASPSSVHPLSDLMRCSASTNDSLAIGSFLRFLRADLVEPDARRFDGIERVLLHLLRGRTLGRIRERAAGDRPMIRALRFLQLLKSGGVRALPFLPVHNAPNRLGRTPWSAASTRLSSIASATRDAVSGASKTPLR